MGWYRKAQGRIFGKTGRGRKRVPITGAFDDDGDTTPVVWAQKQFSVNEPSKMIAVKWLRTARANLQRERGYDGVSSRQRRRVNRTFRPNR